MPTVNRDDTSAATHFTSDEFLESADAPSQATLQLHDGARVGVIGGGPAGSFFSFFLLDMAQNMGMNLELDIFEPRDFSSPAPRGCNMCGGIVSESLVQYLATEGINLPPTVVQRGIDAYTMHTDAGSTDIKTPLNEKRIAAVHRGAGPRDVEHSQWLSFDGYLLNMAADRGARIRPARVREVRRLEDGRVRLSVRGQKLPPYDLVGVAVGVNAAAGRMFKEFEFDYQPPQTTKTAIREYNLGQ
ncbi:MAG: hypothetical protein JSW55_07050, partial [Chloroflexota bacterium]